MKEYPRGPHSMQCYIGIYANNVFAVDPDNPDVVSLNCNNLDMKIHQWGRSGDANIKGHKFKIRSRRGLVGSVLAY